MTTETRPPGPASCETCNEVFYTDAEEQRHTNETGHMRYWFITLTDCTQEPTP